MGERSPNTGWIAYYLQGSGQKEVQEWVSSMLRLRQMFEDENEEVMSNKVKILSPELRSPTAHSNSTYNRGSLVFEVESVLPSSDIPMIPNSALLIISTLFNYLEERGMFPRVRHTET